MEKNKKSRLVIIDGTDTEPEEVMDAIRNLMETLHISKPCDCEQEEEEEEEPEERDTACKGCRYESDCDHAACKSQPQDEPHMSEAQPRQPQLSEIKARQERAERIYLIGEVAKELYTKTAAHYVRTGQGDITAMSERAIAAAKVFYKHYHDFKKIEENRWI